MPLNRLGVQVTEPTEENGQNDPMDNANALQAIQELAKAFGVHPYKLMSALGQIADNKRDLKNATCPKCGNRYRVWANYQDDQGMCPACKDEAEAPNRAKMMKPERDEAERKKREYEAAEAAKKQDENEKLLSMVRAVVSEMVPAITRKQSDPDLKAKRQAAAAKARAAKAAKKQAA